MFGFCGNFGMDTFKKWLVFTAILTVFFITKKFRKIKRNQKKKKRTSIGVKSELQLIATNVYRAMFKKSLKNEK